MTTHQAIAKALTLISPDSRNETVNITVNNDGTYDLTISSQDNMEWRLTPEGLERVKKIIWRDKNDK